MSYTKYPTELDDSTSLPPTVDLVTPVKGEVPNRIRDAVLAIESELGTNPSSTYSNVKDRLDSIELNISNSDSAEPVAIMQESITVLIDSQTSFTLSNTPIDNSTVQMYFNGIKQQNGVDYSTSGTTVTYLGTPSLETTDIVEFWYIVTASVSSGDSTLVTEALDVRVTALEAIQSLTPRTVTDDAIAAAVYDSIVYSGTCTATLPEAELNVGKMIMFEADGTGSITVSVIGGGTINGAVSREHTADDAQFAFWSTGTEWRTRGTIGAAP